MLEMLDSLENKNIVGEMGMTEFIPKESDKVWMTTLWSELALDGIWGTDWAIYKKVDEKTIAVVENNPVLPKEHIEVNIERVKIVAEAIGLKFIDRRKDGVPEEVPDKKDKPQEETSKEVK